MEQIDDQPAANALQSQTADQKEVIALLKRQNLLLESLQRNITAGMRREDEQHNTIVTRVIDVNMSIGSMIGFMLKWLIASIPVAIIIGLAWWLMFAGVLGSLLAHRY
jgi:hypothetical protein